LASRFLAAIVVVLLALPTGCTTQSYAPGTAAATRELKVNVGDDILVVTTRHERLSLRITEVRSDRFVGVTSGRFPFRHRTDPFPEWPTPKDRRPAGEKVEVPYEDLAVLQLAVLQVPRFDAKTAGLVTVVLAVSVAGAAAVIHSVAPVGILAIPP
jgi:hypothetical protein